MAHTEKTIASQTLFEGRIIEVRRDKVELENGRQSTRELVLHHGGVCVAALDEQDRILLVRQFRYPYGKEIIELPAGKIEKGEDPRECGIRELQEECGCTADRFEKLTELYPTPSFWTCCGCRLSKRCGWCWRGRSPTPRPRWGFCSSMPSAWDARFCEGADAPSALPNVGGEAPHGPHERALRPAPRPTFSRRESRQRYARNLLVPGPPAKGA